MKLPTFLHLFSVTFVTQNATAALWGRSTGTDPDPPSPEVPKPNLTCVLFYGDGVCAFKCRLFGQGAEGRCENKACMCKLGDVTYIEGENGFAAQPQSLVGKLSNFELEPYRNSYSPTPRSPQRDPNLDHKYDDGDDDEDDDDGPALNLNSKSLPTHFDSPNKRQFTVNADLVRTPSLKVKPNDTGATKTPRRIKRVPEKPGRFSFTFPTAKTHSLHHESPNKPRISNFKSTPLPKYTVRPATAEILPMKPLKDPVKVDAKIATRPNSRPTRLHVKSNGGGKRRPPLKTPVPKRGASNVSVATPPVNKPDGPKHDQDIDSHKHVGLEDASNTSLNTEDKPEPTTQNIVDEKSVPPGHDLKKPKLGTTEEADKSNSEEPKTLQSETLEPVDISGNTDKTNDLPEILKPIERRPRTKKKTDQYPLYAKHMSMAERFSSLLPYRMPQFGQVKNSPKEGLLDSSKEESNEAQQVNTKPDVFKNRNSEIEPSFGEKEEDPLIQGKEKENHESIPEVTPQNVPEPLDAAGDSKILNPTPENEIKPNFEDTPLRELPVLPESPLEHTSSAVEAPLNEQAPKSDIADVKPSSDSISPDEFAPQKTSVSEAGTEPEKDDEIYESPWSWPWPWFKKPKKRDPEVGASSKPQEASDISLESTEVPEVKPKLAEEEKKSKPAVDVDKFDSPEEEFDTQNIPQPADEPTPHGTVSGDDAMIPSPDPPAVKQNSNSQEDMKPPEKQLNNEEKSQEDDELPTSVAPPTTNRYHQATEDAATRGENAHNAKYTSPFLPKQEESTLSGGEEERSTSEESERPRPAESKINRVSPSETEPFPMEREYRVPATINSDRDTQPEVTKSGEADESFELGDISKEGESTEGLKEDEPKPAGTATQPGVNRPGKGNKLVKADEMPVKDKPTEEPEEKLKDPETTDSLGTNPTDGHLQENPKTPDSTEQPEIINSVMAEKEIPFSSNPTAEPEQEDSETTDAVERKPTEEPKQEDSRATDAVDDKPTEEPKLEDPKATHKLESKPTEEPKQEVLKVTNTADNKPTEEPKQEDAKGTHVVESKPTEDPKQEDSKETDIDNKPTKEPNYEKSEQPEVQKSGDAKKLAEVDNIPIGTKSSEEPKVEEPEQENPEATGTGPQPEAIKSVEGEKPTKSVDVPEDRKEIEQPKQESPKTTDTVETEPTEKPERKDSKAIETGDTEVRREPKEEDPKTTDLVDSKPTGEPKIIKTSGEPDVVKSGTTDNPGKADLVPVNSKPVEEPTPKNHEASDSTQPDLSKSEDSAKPLKGDDTPVKDKSLEAPEIKEPTTEAPEATGDNSRPQPGRDGDSDHLQHEDDQEQVLDEFADDDDDDDDDDLLHPETSPAPASKVQQPHTVNKSEDSGKPAREGGMPKKDKSLEVPEIEERKNEAPEIEGPKKESTEIEESKKEVPEIQGPKKEAPELEEPKKEVPETDKPEKEAPEIQEPKTEALKATDNRSRPQPERKGHSDHLQHEDEQEQVLDEFDDDDDDEDSLNLETSPNPASKVQLPPHARKAEETGKLVKEGDMPKKDQSLEASEVEKPKADSPEATGNHSEPQAGRNGDSDHLQHEDEQEQVLDEYHDDDDDSLNPETSSAPAGKVQQPPFINKTEDTDKLVKEDDVPVKDKPLEAPKVEEPKTKAPEATGNRSQSQPAGSGDSNHLQHEDEQEQVLDEYHDDNDDSLNPETSSTPANNVQQPPTVNNDKEKSDVKQSAKKIDEPAPIANPGLVQNPETLLAEKEKTAVPNGAEPDLNKTEPTASSEPKIEEEKIVVDYEKNDGDHKDTDTPKKSLEDLKKTEKPHESTRQEGTKPEKAGPNAVSSVNNIDPDPKTHKPEELVKPAERRQETDKSDDKGTQPQKSTPSPKEVEGPSKISEIAKEPSNDHGGKKPEVIKDSPVAASDPADVGRAIAPPEEMTPPATKSPPAKKEKQEKNTANTNESRKPADEPAKKDEPAEDHTEHVLDEFEDETPAEDESAPDDQHSGKKASEPAASKSPTHSVTSREPVAPVIDGNKKPEAQPAGSGANNQNEMQSKESDAKKGFDKNKTSEPTQEPLKHNSEAPELDEHEEVLEEFDVDHPDDGVESDKKEIPPANSVPESSNNPHNKESPSPGPSDDSPKPEKTEKQSDENKDSNPDAKTIIKEYTEERLHVPEDVTAEPPGIEILLEYVMQALAHEGEEGSKL